MDMEQWLITLVNNYPVLVYALIVLISFVEGPILTILCGIIWSLGIVSFWPIYIALMVGDLIGDIVWYWIGRLFGHRFIGRFGKYFSIEEKEVTIVSKIFHKYKNSILLVSKITMGLGFALVTLITAGIVKIPFKRYLTVNTVGQVVWTAVLLIVGYLFGDLYAQFDNIFGKISLIGLIVLAALVLIGYGKYVRTRLSKAVSSS
jgi:membrane-associated protein